MNNLSAPASAKMLLLQSDKKVLKDIYIAFDSIEKVIFQIQRDITSESNRDEVGPTILALKQVLEILTLFSLEGESIVKQENSTK